MSALKYKKREKLGLVVFPYVYLNALMKISLSLTKSNEQTEKSFFDKVKV